MICRRIARENGQKTIVWFGSYGKNGDGTAMFFNPSNIHDNYGTENVAVADSLTQRLNVLKNELWYNINYGLPLLEKNISKLAIDMSVASIIEQHPDVLDILSFESKVVGRQYFGEIVISTIYGELNLTI